MEQEQNNTPCKEAHRINNIIPGPNDLHLAGQNCDCGRIAFYLEKCNCPNGGPGTLKSKPNQ